MLQCCTTLNKWKDPIGNVCIYDIMGPTPRRYRGDDEEEWGDDDTGVPLMGATSVDSCFSAHQVACVVVSLTSASLPTALRTGRGGRFRSTQASTWRRSWRSAGRRRRLRPSSPSA